MAHISKCVRWLKKYCDFETLGLKRVYLNVLADNKRANAFYRKVGFRFVREEPEALELLGKMKTLNWYEIIGETYREDSNGSKE